MLRSELIDQLVRYEVLFISILKRGDGIDFNIPRLYGLIRGSETMQHVSFGFNRLIRTNFESTLWCREREMVAQTHCV